MQNSKELEVKPSAYMDAQIQRSKQIWFGYSKWKPWVK